MATSVLPECTPTSCAPCNIGASTMCISFPYQFIDEATSTISVIPYVTQYEDGRKDSTFFSTMTLNEDPECDFFDEHFTWVTAGRTLTWPTTYGLLQDFVGRAESTFDSTKTYSSEGKDCDGTVGTTPLALPSTLDQGSLIIPLGVSSATLKAGPLPQTVIAYLDTFSTVHEQLNEIPITSCAPALPVRTACTTVLTSTSTSVSCDNQDVCVTALETVVETNTHTPFWPTLNGSLTDIKRSAARLTTEIGETQTVVATAESLVVPSSSTDEESTSTTETETPSRTEEASPSSSDVDEATTSPTSDIEPATTGATSTGSETLPTLSRSALTPARSQSTGSGIVSGSDTPTGTSSPPSSEETGSMSSRIQSSSTSGATASPQDAASQSSSACRGADVSARGWGVLLFGVAVLTMFEII
ncbi:hypothetical protein Q7P36_008799 [Cladosporium allicinum]